MFSARVRVAQTTPKDKVLQRLQMKVWDACIIHTLLQLH